MGVAINTIDESFVSNTVKNSILKLDIHNNVTLIAGDIENDGHDGLFNHPQGIVINSKGELFVADTYNYKIQKRYIHKNVTTIAGDGINCWRWNQR